MKKFLFILMLFFVLIGESQTYPINQNFNSGLGGWVVTNGAGIQASNYLTTNIGSTPYPNNANVTMTSPVYNFTNCVGTLSINYKVYGLIENTYDYMYFEYFNGVIWTTLWTYTGTYIPAVIYNFNIPNTATTFRFRLVSDCSINGYSNSGGGSQCSVAGYSTTCTPSAGNCNGVVSVYYYDIDYFNISCTNALPIELLYFGGEQKFCNQNILTWATATETNNDHFEIERSSDAINFKTIKEIPGSINSLEIKKYVYIDSNPESGINYYRLKQIDLDGTYKYAPIIDVDNSCLKNLKIMKISNLLGQEVTEDFGGPKFIYYNDGSVIKKVGE